MSKTPFHKEAPLFQVRELETLTFDEAQKRGLVPTGPPILCMKSWRNGKPVPDQPGYSSRCEVPNDAIAYVWSLTHVIVSAEKPDITTHYGSIQPYYRRK